MEDTTGSPTEVALGMYYEFILAASVTKRIYNSKFTPFADLPTLRECWGIITVLGAAGEH